MMANLIIFNVQTVVMSGLLLTHHSLDYYPHLWLLYAFRSFICLWKTCWTCWFQQRSAFSNICAANSFRASQSAALQIHWMYSWVGVLFTSKPQSWVCYSCICPFKFMAVFLHAGKVSDVSSPDRTHFPPGGEDLQETRTSSGGLLPHRPHLHLHGLRRDLAQVPRHCFHWPRVEEEDGELWPPFLIDWWP